MLDYQPKACTPETKRSASMLNGSRSKRRPGYDGDYNAFFTDSSPIIRYRQPPSINRGFFPEILSVSKDIRDDLMPDYLRLL